MSPNEQAAADDQDRSGTTRHGYPAAAMVGDYLRAAAGLVPAGAIFATMPVGTVPGMLLGGFAAVFAVFGVRTALRHNTSIEMDDTELRAHGIAQRTIVWSELDRLRLSYYSTSRDRKSGWMQLELAAAGAKLSLDSRIEGFDLVVRRAGEAAAARHIELNQSTAANLESLGIRVPEWQIER